jgi:hypothetical protein
VRTALSISLLPLCVPLPTLSAQAEQPTLQYGQRVRIETCTPTCEWRYKGALVEWTSEVAALDVEGATVLVPQSEITAVEAATGGGFSGRGAALGAAVGGLTFAGLALKGDGEAVAAGVVGAGVGAVFGGGGNSSLKSGFVGAAIGGVAGLVLGVATYEEPDPCTGWFCFNFGPSNAGQAGLWGAAGGAGLGFLIGGIVGALNPSEDWVAAPMEGFQVSLVTGDKGLVGLAATVSF